MVLNLYRFLLIYIILIISTTTKPFYPPEIILAHNFIHVKPDFCLKRMFFAASVWVGRVSKSASHTVVAAHVSLQHLSAGSAGGAGLSGF